MSDIRTGNDVRDAVIRACSRIGHSNGHACPHSASNIEPLLHRMFVASIAADYWSKELKAAVTAALDTADPNAVPDLVTRVTKEQLGASTQLSSGTKYAFNLEVKKPASRLDTKMLRNKLELSGKFTEDEIKSLFDACTKQNSPAKSFTVVPL